jgi:hypothetical protein
MHNQISLKKYQQQKSERVIAIADIHLITNQCQTSHFKTSRCKTSRCKGSRCKDSNDKINTHFVNTWDSVIKLTLININTLAVDSVIKLKHWQWTV